MAGHDVHVRSQGLRNTHLRGGVRRAILDAVDRTARVIPHDGELFGSVNLGSREQEQCDG